jgi:hypothetical protein
MIAMARSVSRDIGAAGSDPLRGGTAGAGGGAGASADAGTCARTARPASTAPRTPRDAIVTARENRHRLGDDGSRGSAAGGIRLLFRCATPQASQRPDVMHNYMVASLISRRICLAVPCLAIWPKRALLEGHTKFNVLAGLSSPSTA